jgi:hypothetical protein
MASDFFIDLGSCYRNRCSKHVYRYGDINATNARTRCSIIISYVYRSEVESLCPNKGPFSSARIEYFFSQRTELPTSYVTALRDSRTPTAPLFLPVTVPPTLSSRAAAFVESFFVALITFPTDPSPFPGTQLGRGTKKVGGGGPILTLSS